MNSLIATILTLGFIAYLFRFDRRSDGEFSSAMWIPFLWVLVACSRSVTGWLDVFGIDVPGGSLEDGNPVNRTFYLALIGSGLYILSRRQVRLGELMHHNQWLTIFLAYCFLSVFWSEFPVVSLKRWIKVIGHPIMALILLTEKDPEKSVMQLLRRVSFVVVPVSVLFIKYYPDLGRGFSPWTGAGYNTGITTDKNALGRNCLIFAMLYVWQLTRLRSREGVEKSKNEWILLTILSIMTGWLFFKADSKTPLVSFLVGLIVYFFCGLKWVRARAISYYILGAGLLLLAFQMLFNIYETFLRLLGKDPTLTDRTILWAELFKVEVNPLFGTGFESFWLGERLDRLWERFSWQPNQAHNGYIETYLNLGLVGLILLAALLLATYSKIVRALPYTGDWGRFRLGLLVAIILYNWTEAAFKTTHSLFFMFYLVSFEVQRRWLAQESEERAMPPAGGTRSPVTL